jgi:hypothetical protein
VKISLGGKIDIDLSRLVASRMLLQANSGGGKSWTLRRILEQSHGRIQQIVIDPEDEFYTLREKFDYILVRHDGGDCVPELRSADLLARRLLELGVSAIISIYELSPRDRREFVRRFLESLVNAPKNLWHPALVVVDEAHEYCPEQGKKQKGDAVADAVIDLMAKGRKRGFCGILATQRLSKLNKDAAAEANNKLIGRASIDVDRKRAGEELGFASKEDVLSLRQLAAGEFFAFGPAISSDVVRFKVGNVETTHPKAGTGAVPIAPPKTKVKSILAQLADLPQEAEQERASVADLQSKVRELTASLKQAQREHPAPAPKIETKTKEIFVLKDGQLKRAEDLIEQSRNAEKIIRDAANMLEQWVASVSKVVAPIAEAIAETRSASPPGRIYYGDRIPRHEQSPLLTGTPTQRASRPQEAAGKAAPVQRDSASVDGEIVITKSRQKILNALATLESLGIATPTREQVAGFTVTPHTSGGFKNNLGALRSADLITYPQPGTIALTGEGRKISTNDFAFTTVNGLHQLWLGKLPASRSNILQACIDIYPQSITREELSQRVDQPVTSGGFKNNLGALRTLGLIDYPSPGLVVATETLFPPGLT